MRRHTNKWGRKRKEVAQDTRVLGGRSAVGQRGAREGGGIIEHTLIHPKKKCVLVFVSSVWVCTSSHMSFLPRRYVCAVGSCLCRTAKRSAAQRKCIKNYETARTVSRGREPNHPLAGGWWLVHGGLTQPNHPKHPS